MVVTVLLEYELDCFCFFLTQAVLQQAVVEDGPELPVIVEHLPVLFPLMQQQGGNILHKVSSLAASKRVAHSDVHLVDVLRNGLQRRQKQALVGQDDGAFHSRPVETHSFEHPSDLLALSHLRRHLQHVYHRAVRAVVSGPEGLREVYNIVFQEEGRFVFGVFYPVAAIVPAELGQPGIAHSAQNFLFTFIEGVEADEDEFAFVGEGL